MMLDTAGLAQICQQARPRPEQLGRTDALPDHSEYGARRRRISAVGPITVDRSERVRRLQDGMLARS
jgi:hypothetical protein